MVYFDGDNEELVIKSLDTAKDIREMFSLVLK